MYKCLENIAFQENVTCVNSLSSYNARKKILLKIEEVLESIMTEFRRFPSGFLNSNHLTKMSVKNIFYRPFFNPFSYISRPNFCGFVPKSKYTTTYLKTK